MESTAVLPYRTDASTLGQWLTARARGRSAESLRGAADSPKGVEGTAAAAAALGFVDGGEGDLTAAGERYALADGVERRAMLREALLAFPPYRELLQALSERGMQAETEVRWIEAWWATRGYGSSESNRREGAAAFGRLAEFAGLGEYVSGRRGHPTRVRWTPGTLLRVAADPDPPRLPDRQKPGRGGDPDLFSATYLQPATEPPPAPPIVPAREVVRPAATPLPTASPEPPRAGKAGSNGSGPTVNRITVPFSNETLARLELPLRLPRADKRRLLDLLQLLITEE